MTERGKTEREMFENTLDYFTEKYNLVIKRPYGDTYIEIYKHNKFIGSMNYGGFNLLYNLSVLTSMLRKYE